MRCRFGNVMASRWGFEALAVDLARNNPFDTHFAMWEDRIYQAGWRRDFWLAELKRIDDPSLLTSELERSAKELSEWEGRPFDWGFATPEDADFEAIKARYNTHYGEAFKARNDIRHVLATSDDLVALKGQSHNDELWEWVLQDDRKKRAVWVNGEVIQKAGPIHRSFVEAKGLDATMYAPYKTVAGTTTSTLAYNVLMLLAMSVVMWASLLIQPWLLSKPWTRVKRPATSPQV